MIESTSKRVCVRATSGGTTSVRRRRQRSSRSQPGLSWDAPESHPEELAVSIVGRHLQRWGYLDRSRMLRELLGIPFRTFNGICPSGVPGLAAATAVSDGPEGLVVRHTLLPYVVMHEPTKYARERLRCVATSSSSTTLRSLHFTSLRSSHATWLRYCPECSIVDRRSSQPYWRRIHQLSAISTCP